MPQSIRVNLVCRGALMQVLWKSNDTMPKLNSITPSIYELFVLKYFLKILLQILTIFKVLDNPTVCPVHFELFRSSVIRGPWILLEKYVVEGLTKN